MKWRDLRRSRNVEDRRGGARGGGIFGRGRATGPRARGGRGRAVGRGGLIALIFVALAFIFPQYAGIFNVLGGLFGGGSVVSGPGPGVAPTAGPGRNDEISGFVSATLGLTEDVWSSKFEAGRVPGFNGRPAPRQYRDVTLVLFEGGARSSCGLASAQTGPFYCPADQKIYIDPGFFDVMAQRMRAGGDFAQAYVIAHEVAHHIQNLTGALDAVHRARQVSSRVEINRMTVRIELQADCYAGVWAREADSRYRVMDEGDLREALQAAHAVGDDVLMRMAGARVDPDEFTHGSAEQRVTWFRRGFETGDPRACDTFSQAYSAL